ncbi:hypothetical protein PAMP_006474 [Pampus punctatissimus]
MAAALLPLPRHLPPLPLPSGLDQVQIARASGKVGGVVVVVVVKGRGPGFGLETSPGATLAGGDRGWEAAMPTWVMMEEVEEQAEAVVEGKELKHQVKLEEG